jgi:hypothetical protein
MANQRVCLRQGNGPMPNERTNDFSQVPDGDIYLMVERNKGAYNFFEPGKLYTINIEKA